MGKPKGLYPTLDEAVRRYERERGVVIDYIIIAPHALVSVKHADGQRLLTKRPTNWGTHDYPLNGRAHYVWDRDENVWRRACLIERDTNPMDDQEAMTWLAGSEVPASEVVDQSKRLPAEREAKLRAMGAERIPDHMPAFRYGCPDGWGFKNAEKAAAFWRRLPEMRRSWYNEDPRSRLLEDAV